MATAMSSRSSPHPSSTFATPWGWAAGGAVLGLLAALLVFAPARWLAAGVSQASGGQVTLADPVGTVWTGSARLVLSGGVDSQGRVALPGRVDWHLAPSFGRLQADLNAPCCMTQVLRLNASPAWGSAGLNFKISVQDHQSRWPASLLTGLGTPWNTVQAQGVLALSTQGLSLEWAEGRLGMAGRVQLDAQDMGSRLSTLKPMGSYRLQLTGGPVVTLQLETLQGALQLSGNGQWVGGRLRFDGVATSAPDRQDALSNLLNIIGRRDGARSLIKVG
jgi:general secretion pathway protein N